MLNKLQIFSGMNHYFQMVLSDDDAYTAINADMNQQITYKTRLKELLIRMAKNNYIHSTLANNGILVRNIDFKQTPLLTAIEDVLPDARLPFPSVALEFEVKYNELLKPSQQNGFYTSQVLILADEVESKKYGKLIRISPLYQVHNFTTGQKHYTVSPVDLFINTNVEILSNNPESVILMQKGHNQFSEITAFEYQNLGSEMSSISSLLQWLMALSCDNVVLKKGTPPTQAENNQRLKKNKPILNQYDEAQVISSMNQKVKEKVKFGSIYILGHQKIWKNN